MPTIDDYRSSLNETTELVGDVRDTGIRVSDLNSDLDGLRDLIEVYRIFTDELEGKLDLVERVSAVMSKIPPTATFGNALSEAVEQVVIVLGLDAEPPEIDGGEVFGGGDTGGDTGNDEDDEDDSAEQQSIIARVIDGIESALDNLDTVADEVDSITEFLTVVEGNMLLIDDSVQGFLDEGAITNGGSAELAVLNLDPNSPEFLDALSNPSSLLPPAQLVAMDAVLAVSGPLNDAIDAVEPVLDDVSDALSFIDLDDVTGVIEQITDDIAQFFEPLDPVLEAVNEALEPIEWVFEAGDAAQDFFIENIVDPLLEATGLDQVVDDVSSGVNNVILDALAPVLNAAEDVVENVLGSEVFQTVDDVLTIGTQIRDVLNDPASLIVGFYHENPDGSTVQVGSNADNFLLGTEFDDNFAIGAGDDDVFGLGGTDRVWLDGGIEDFVLTTSDPDKVEISLREPASSDQKSALTTGVELFRFQNPGLGDVTRDDIDAFLYVTPSNDPLVGDEDDNWLIGDDKGNLLIGRGGDDTIIGAEGDDVIFGEAGRDFVLAGEGDDTIFIEDADSVLGGEGTDRVVLDIDQALEVDFSSSDIDLGAGIGVLSVDGVEEIEGTEFSDTYIGSAGVDGRFVLSGGGDDQFLQAGEGDSFFNTDYENAVTTMSFANGGYMGVSVDVRSAPAGAPDPGMAPLLSNAILSDVTAEPGSAVFSFASDVQAFVGTSFGDVFYALGVYREQGEPAPLNREFCDGGDCRYAFDFKGNTVELTGNAFFGGDGGDVFFGSELINAFDGGDGFDILNYNLDEILDPDGTSLALDNGVKIDLGQGLVRSLQNNGEVIGYFSGIEGIVGTADGDELIGDDNANQIVGYAGDDTIFAKGGNDVIDISFSNGATAFGGMGNDFFAIDRAKGSTVDGEEGVDTVELSGGRAFRMDEMFDPRVNQVPGLNVTQDTGYTVELGLNGAAGSAVAEFSDDQESGILFETTLIDIENIIGSERDDTITGNEQSNFLAGEEGNDTVMGGGGNDAVDGGAGADEVFGGAGDDFVSGGDDAKVPGDGPKSNFNDPSLNGVLTTIVENAPVDGWENVNGKVQLFGTEAVWATPFVNDGSIDLDVEAHEPGGTADTLSKTFDTEEGTYYRLQFDMLGRDGGEIDDPTNGLRLLVNGVEIQPSEVQLSNGETATGPYLSPTSIEEEFVTYSFDFKATGSDTITFAEVDTILDENGEEVQIGSDGVGPVLDNINLLPLGEIDTLTGGEGADTFILFEKGGDDIITDFEPGVDMISLTSTGIALEELDLRPVEDGGTEIFAFGTRVGMVQGVAPTDLTEEDFLLQTVEEDDTGPDQSLYDILAESGDTFDDTGTDFDVLLAAVDYAGLQETLEQVMDDYTLFAPTDQAFLDLTQALDEGVTTEEDAYNALIAFATELDTDNPQSALAEILSYHLLEDPLLESEMGAASPLETVQGGEIDYLEGILVDENDTTTDAALTDADMLATNGVAHAIDQVLLPGIEEDDEEVPTEGGTSGTEPMQDDDDDKGFIGELLVGLGLAMAILGAFAAV